MLDIVWDDMIDLKVEYPPVDKILGSAKYESVNMDIQLGLGIPDVLAGKGSGAGGAAGFIHLKTLVERLEYVRDKALEWLQGEFRLVMKAMRWKIAPIVAFENMSLRDESVEKQLLIQLVDRGLISVEALHHAFDKNTLLELERLRREQEFRKGNSPVIERAGPYYRPVSQLTTQFEQQRELMTLKGNTGGGGGNGGGDNQAGDLPRTTQNSPKPGRPPNTKDTKQRDTRTPKSYSVLQVLAESALSQIDEIMDPIFLASAKKPNIRSLSGSQRADLESVKAALLAGIKPGDSIDSERLRKMAKSGDARQAKGLLAMGRELADQFKIEIGPTPNTAERRK